MKDYTVKIFTIISAFFFLLQGCANQQPPSGGDDDKIAPKIQYIYPSNGAVNFSGKTITIEFDEYVDRRSFIDALFITPKPPGEINYNWSGKTVEIEFSGSLAKNITYLVILGKSLKDIRGNSLNSPVSLAFSTGGRIDKGKIKGKVYSEKNDRTFILAYKLGNKPDSLLNPARYPADFVMPAADNGLYSFENLPDGMFRLFALYDGDRNALYDKEFDYISMLNEDKEIVNSDELKDCNFILEGFIRDEAYRKSREFFNLLKADSSRSIYSSVIPGDKDIPVNPKFYFYFKNTGLTHEEIAVSSKLADSLNNNVRIIYNWFNDSLLEILPAVPLNFNENYNFSFAFKKSLRKGDYSISFRTSSERKSGSISGLVRQKSAVNSNVIIKLFNTDDPFLNYSRILTSDSLYIFEGLKEGKYKLFSFIDEKQNNSFDRGEPYPYKPAGKFFIFDGVLDLKGGWKIENVIVKF